MSYIGLNPAQLGVLVPQDPVTGLLQVDSAIAFDLLTSVQVGSPSMVAKHPVQSGAEGPSDAIMEEPEHVSVTGSFVDKPHPDDLQFLPTLDAQPDRCFAQMDALRSLKARRRLLTAILPGFVLADRAIGNLDLTPNPDATEVSVSLTLEHVRVVSLTLVPVQVDADSKALGQQTTKIGLQ